jgi:NAD(P)H-hydrate epimerase
VLPSDTGVISPEAVAVLRRHLGQYHVLLLGPGLSGEKPTVEFVASLLAGAEGRHRSAIGFVERRRPAGLEEALLPALVIDADGLNALAGQPSLLERLPVGTVLTPHPGEMARLLGVSVEEAQRDRLQTASGAAERWHAVVVLKGAMTVVAGPGGDLAVAPFANPGLASGGTGDVLAGALAGLLAQGMAPFAAACAAVYLHGMAGEMARAELGGSGMVAGDLLELLPRAQSLLRQGWR